MAQHRLRTHPLVLRRVEVARVVDVTPRMRRVTLVGPELGAFERDGLPMPAFDAPGFDDHVKLVLASDGDVASALPVQRAHGIDWPPAPNRQGRDYTPRRWDPVAGELDLDLVLHGDGPAAAWAGAARPGDALWFVGPKASTVWPDDVDWALLAGDETALPAIGRFLDERPVDVPVQVVVTVGDASAHQDLALRDGDTVRWVVAPEGDRVALGEAVRAITWWPGRVYAWAASESRALLPVRRHLTRERGVPRTHVDVTGYWHAQPAPSGARPGDTAGSTVGDTAGGVPGSTASDVPSSTATGTVPATQPAGVPSPVPWFATRAALQLGLLDALGDGPRDVAVLAEAARVAPAAVRVLVDVLAASGVVTADGDKVALADAGEDLLDDEHAREEYEGLEADAVLALAALAPALREDAPAWARSRGRTLRAEVEADADLAAEVVEGADVLPYVLTGLPTWPVWSGVRSVAVGGPGALVVADLLADVPGDRTTTLVEDPVPLAVLREQAGTGSPHATSGSWPGADLAVCALGTGHRTDDEVVALLAAMGAAARRAVLVEDLTPDGLSPHAHEHALLSLATTGSGPRTPDDVARLAARAGWRVVGHDALGWGVARVELAR
ncbi:siderophore-interacting protein [Cellulosimicrobium funkei]|uniref:Siderophore-interacting protein n=1 Tax=Cellulosimicrobium funkei TaxID=264251 RepID=A0A4Y8R543_9MICO|nr:siderophore-interacting protein [Cellulosimicrobium funkei]TFF16638.1 siderophore-interacting protein [Cellulosimicrobium funkei]TGA78532.1 siderophore-interacting protein [Cellulosimicrobium terreum]